MWMGFEVMGDLDVALIIRFLDLFGKNLLLMRKLYFYFFTLMVG